jgi:hypothetical protein
VLASLLGAAPVCAQGRISLLAGPVVSGPGAPVAATEVITGDFHNDGRFATGKTDGTTYTDRREIRMPAPPEFDDAFPEFGAAFTMLGDFCPANGALND